MLIHWLITAGLVAIAYKLGFRHGEVYFNDRTTRILNKIAFKLGVPKDEPFWNSSQDWQQALQDVKTDLEKQVRDED